MDREKVIKGIHQHCEGSMFDRCGECPYYEIDHEPFVCRDMLLNDLNELLKEQEAELSFREPKAITHTATKLDDATCPSCGNVVGEKIRTGAIGQSVVQVRWDYCCFCGQKLDWEGR